MAKQIFIELGNAFAFIRMLRGLHLFQDPRVTTYSPLTEDHQAACHDIGTFDRNRNGCCLPATAQIIFRTKNDAFTGIDIHCIASEFARHFGAMIFRDSRWHRWFFTAINRRCGGLRKRTAGIGIAGDTSQRFFNAFKAADRQTKLFANACVSTGDNGSEF